VTLPARHLPVPGAHNIRDLGGYAVPDGRMTRWRRVLRGDGLHALEPAAVGALRAEGLGTVIDLRAATELAREPNPFAAHPEVTFENRPVFDDLAPATMADARPGAEDDLLLGFYLAALEDRGDALRDILSAIAAAPPGAVLFHCTAGKDRTGIVAALVLGAAGVDRQTILEDYALTGELIAPLAARLLERTRKAGGDTARHARLLACERPTMAAMLDRLDQRHGSVTGYLRDIGLPAGDLSALRDRLLEGT
jgi:protein-tyrosine phosphatase